MVKWGKWLTAWILVGIIFVIYGYLIHGTLLKGRYESLTGFNTPLTTTQMGLSIVVTLVEALIFTLFYAVTWKSFRPGIEGGLYYGLLAGILVFVPANLFVMIYMRPEIIPIDLARFWILFGIIQYLIGGLIAGLVFREKETS